MIKPTVLELSQIQMEPGMQANGKMICSMEMERKAGIKVKPHTLDSSLRVKSMAKEDLYGRTAATMMAILQMDSLKVTESITSLTWTSTMKVNLE